MTRHDRYRWILGLAAGMAMVAAAAGCNKNYRHGESYPGGDETRDLQRFNQVQAARGAREDATLRDYHFEAGQLNTLGQERLDQMVSDGDVASSLVVYLDIPQNNDLAPRQHAVALYLKDRGLRDEQVRLENGPNPNSSFAAVPLFPASQSKEKDTPAPASIGASGPVPAPAPAMH